ncbi:MAG: hypothetical protein EBW19_05860, partial [Betaproteobacteria bacterium]|nr:hypothetical protein [Betaproteobacteria bacterium]
MFARTHRLERFFRAGCRLFGGCLGRLSARADAAHRSHPAGRSAPAAREFARDAARTDHQRARPPEARRQLFLPRHQHQVL